jgi:extradiol dioxygenase family protein
MDFFGDQVVCHLNEGYVLEEPTLYPRHFGVTFRKKKDFDSLYDMSIKNKIPFFKDQFTRFRGKKEEHQSFLLSDFSNNILEFKWYIDPQCMY